MYTDPIADLLTRLRNAQAARNNLVRVPYSKLKHEILKTLVQEKFLVDAKRVETDAFPELEITLDLSRPQITFTRVSKPGQRVYKKNEELKLIKNGLGIEVVSTSKGLMTNAQAYKSNLGGEIICKVY